MTGPLDIQRALASLGRAPRRARKERRRDGLIQERHCRETGHQVAIYDLDADTPFISRGTGEYREHRWLTLCRGHGHLCTHPTRRLAEDHATMPTGWCEPCRDGEPALED